MNTGGPCSYACTGGKCACDAGSRFKLTDPSAPQKGFDDSKTNLHWISPSMDKVAPGAFNEALYACVIVNLGYQLPPVDRVLEIIAQQENAAFCDPNFDPVIKKNLDTRLSAFPDVYASEVWTSDATPDKTGHYVVNLKTGHVSVRPDTEKHPGVYLCVK